MNDALEEGLRRQHAERRRRLAAGMPRAGWKICVNDRRMQKKLGLDGSFSGFLDGAKLLASGDSWTIAPGSLPGVEPEFAIRFRADVAAGARPETMRAAIAGVAPALEIVDWNGARFELVHLAATSSFHAGVVIGELRGLAELPEIGEGCPLLRRRDEILGVPDPSLVPRDLVTLVARVAAELGRHGEVLAAGDWLIAGACTNPARVEPGDEIEADFRSLGSVRVRFVA